MMSFNYNVKETIKNINLKVNNNGDFIDVKVFKLKTMTFTFNEKDIFTAVVFNDNQNENIYDLLVDGAIVSISGCGLFKITVTVNDEYKLIYGERID